VALHGFTLGVVLCALLLMAAPHRPSVSAAPVREDKGIVTDERGQGLRLVKSDRESVVLELYTPAYEVSQESLGGLDCAPVSVEGCGDSSGVGRPRLPVRRVMLGVPPGADLKVRILDVDSAPVAGRYDVCPAPKRVLHRDPPRVGFPQEPLGTLPGRVGYEFTPDQAVYGADALYPTQLARVASSGYLRDQRFALLHLHPVQFNPVNQQLTFHRRMTVELRFTYNAGAGAPAGAGEADAPFEAMLRSTLLNYDSARQWRGNAPAAPLRVQGENPLASQTSWKITVEEDGIYRLSYEALSAAGFPSGVLSPTLKLFNQGSQVATHIVDPQGSFGPDDYILFYGQKMNTKYTGTNVYWLTHKGAAGLRMDQKDGAPVGTAAVPTSFFTYKKVEQPKWYISTLAGGDELDRWVWDRFIPPYGSSGSTCSGNSCTYHLGLSTIVTDSLEATLRLSLFGEAPQNHRARLYVNGQWVGDTTWPGNAQKIDEVSFPASHLVEGDNKVRVTGVKDPADPWDKFWSDWVEIGFHDAYVAENDHLRFAGDLDGGVPISYTYQVTGFSSADVAAFDITDPAYPQRITGATVKGGSTYTLTFHDTISARSEYVALTTREPDRRLEPTAIAQDAPSDLYTGGDGADYIIITHADLALEGPGDRDDVYDLEAYRRGQGLRTIVVDVQDIYDEFSYGVFDPRAIRDFLSHAYHNWAPPKPTYVLLVGDGNYDFKNYEGDSPPNYIPPYLSYVDPVLGETATDNRYVAVSGDDLVQDMAIGRLPVSSMTQVATVIGKILGYEQDPPPGDWNQKALFVADNVPDPKNAGDFVGLSDGIVDGFLPDPYVADKVYMNDLGCPPTSPPTPCPAATAGIIAAISEGRLLVNYIGHAGNLAWADEVIFRADAKRNDINALTNGPKLPMLLPMACATGYFHHPSLPCIDERMLWTAGKGAIAAFTASGFGFAIGHDFLDKGFFDAVFQHDVREIGLATWLAKICLCDCEEPGCGCTAEDEFPDLMDTFVLFGDPAMELNVLPADVGISKTVDPEGPVQPGGTLTYTLTYSNAGPATAHNVVISDVLPTQLLNPTVVSSGKVITPRVGTRFVWDVEDLAADEGGTITITVVVAPDASGVIANAATIASTAREGDSQDNVSATLVTDVARPVGGTTYLPFVSQRFWAPEVPLAATVTVLFMLMGAHMVKLQRSARASSQSRGPGQEGDHSP
jgi:uncharacterized repeat protein (TIGR01451 family)